MKDGAMVIPFDKGKAMEGRWRQAQPAWERFIAMAMQDTGQARCVADFLLSWHNAGANGGWNPADLWSVDESIADDLLTVLRLVRECGCYPDELGWRMQMDAIWQVWRGNRQEVHSSSSTTV